jgi:hypothetical protein
MAGRYRVRQRWTTGRVLAQAIRSSMEAVTGPQAAVRASRSASALSAADAVPMLLAPRKSTVAVHSTRCDARVVQRRSVTNPSMAISVKARARAVMVQGTSPRLRLLRGSPRQIRPGASHGGMKRMECSEIERRLWEYLDDELSPEEAGVIGAHLGDCRCCWPAYRCHRAFLERLAHCRLAKVPAPQSLVERLSRLL